MILVGERLNVISKKQWITPSSTSLIALWSCILLFSQTTAANVTVPPPQTPYTAANWWWEQPIDGIQGSYQLLKVKYADHPPILASIWELNGEDFSVVAWPPKYCTAVHVFFINATAKGFGVYHVLPEHAKAPYIKFYPAIGEIEIQTSENMTPVTKYTQRNLVFFESTDPDTYSVEASDEYVDKNRDFETNAKKSNFTFQLSQRLALVLTNSRFCFAHVTRDGFNERYYALFSPATQARDQNIVPKIFSTYENPTGAESIFLPPVHVKGTKSVDLLSVLKPVVAYDMSGKENAPAMFCASYRTVSRNTLNKQIGAISVDSWAINTMQAAAKMRNENFLVQIGQQCSWIRLWISKFGGIFANDYDTTMRLDETIDIFFDQQFIVGPDSDEAHPLSGNSTQIHEISIRRHWFGDESKYTREERIVAVEYGRGQGPARPFVQYFHMPSALKQNFHVHLIKAPNCEANLAQETAVLGYGNRLETNNLQLKSCAKTLLQNTHDGDVSGLTEHHLGGS